MSTTRRWISWAALAALALPFGLASVPRAGMAAADRAEQASTAQAATSQAGLRGGTDETPRKRRRKPRPAQPVQKVQPAAVTPDSRPQVVEPDPGAATPDSVSIPSPPVVEPEPTVAPQVVEPEPTVAPTVVEPKPVVAPPVERKPPTAPVAAANPVVAARSEKTTVTSRADLSISVSDAFDPVIAGERLTYVIAVANAGPSDARNVEVTAIPSPGTMNVATRGCAEDPAGAPLCSLGTIPAGGSKSFSLEAMVDPGAAGKISQQASVTSQTREKQPGDETATEETAIESRANLALSISDSIDPTVGGRPMTYTLVVSNSGPSDAQGVEVANTLPPGATFLATTGCADDPAGSPICSLGTIGVGLSRSYTVAVTLKPGFVGTVIDQASVSAKTAEAQPGEEYAQEETQVEMRSDLRIASSASADPVVAGTSLTYTVRVSNNGPSDALDVVVRDTLPEGVTAASTTGCGEDPAGVPACSLGTIPSGSSKQYLIVVTVASDRIGTISNAVAATSTTPDAGSGAAATTEVTNIETRADLVISSRDSVNPVIAGEPLTYTVTVANHGPSDARDVVATGTLPEQVTLQATAGCAEDGRPGGGLPTCTLGTIRAGGSKQYTLSVLVRSDASGVITNQATVKSSTEEFHPGDESTPRP